MVVLWFLELARCFKPTLPLTGAFVGSSEKPPRGASAPRHPGTHLQLCPQGPLGPPGSWEASFQPTGHAHPSPTPAHSPDPSPSASRSGRLSLVLCAGPQTTGPSGRFLRSQANTRPPLGKWGSQHRPPPKSSHSAYCPSYIINTDGVKGCKNGFYPLDHFPYKPPVGLITVQSLSCSWVIVFGSAEQKVLSGCSSPPGEVLKALRPSQPRV